MKNSEEIRLQKARLVTLLGGLALICSGAATIGGTSYSPIVILIAAAIIWMVPIWKATKEGRHLQKQTALLDVNTYSNKHLMVKWLCYAATVICVLAQIIMFKMIYAKSGNIFAAICGSANYTAYMLFMIIWIVIVPLYYKGTAYDEGIMLNDGFYQWKSMTSYGYEKKEKKDLFIIEFRFQSTTNLSNALPRIKRLYATEKEKAALTAILDKKGVKKINGI